nr:aminopeptidase M1-like isoform X1 [Tanacetum cinerariifolium]
MSDHEDETIPAENAPPKNIPQITNVTNISAKFPYLKKGEYDIWAMKMQNYISSSDLLDIWNAIKARFGGNAESKKMKKSLLKQKFEEFKISEEEGLDKGYDKMQKILSQMNTLQIKPDPEDVNIKFLRGLPPSWSDQQLVYEDLDQMYKEEFVEYDLKHQMAMLSIKVHRFEKKHGRKIKFNGGENARFDKKLVKCFNCKKMGHFSRECRAQGGQNSNNYQQYKEAGKDGTNLKAMVVVNGSVDWDKQTEEGNTEPRSLENFSMLAGIKLEPNADSDGEVVSADDVIPAIVSVSAAADSPHSETEFAFMGLSTKVSIPVTCPLCCDSKYKLIEKDYHEQREQLNDCVVDLKAHKHAVKSLEKQIKCHQTNQLAYEEKIKILSYEIEEKSNILEYRQKLIDQATQEKHELMTKLDNEIANQAKWNNSGTNLYKLSDSSMYVRTKRGLGLDKYIGEGELGIDDSKFSIFHTNSDDLEGQPIYNRFASVDHMKAVPPPLTGNYMPPSHIPDIDEPQMVYEKKATDSSEIKTTDDKLYSTLFILSGSLSLLAQCLSSLSQYKKVVPSEVVVDKDDETLVLVFDEALHVGDGVLEIKFSGVLNEHVNGFYQGCFPCWDQPALKACDAQLTALSNMPVSDETIDGDFKTVSFEEASLMSTYLVAVVVGFFDYIEETTSDVMVAVPDFSGGSMENYGLITYREAELLHDDLRSAAENTQRLSLTVTHEVRQQWFGTWSFVSKCVFNGSLEAGKFIGSCCSVLSYMVFGSPVQFSCCYILIWGAASLVISLNTQEKLCQAMKSTELPDDKYLFTAVPIHADPIEGSSFEKLALGMHRRGLSNSGNSLGKLLTLSVILVLIKNKPLSNFLNKIKRLQ